MRQLICLPYRLVVAPVIGYTTDRILDLVLGPEEVMIDYMTSITQPTTPPPM